MSTTRYDRRYHQPNSNTKVPVLEQQLTSNHRTTENRTSHKHGRSEDAVSTRKDRPSGAHSRSRSAAAVPEAHRSPPSHATATTPAPTPAPATTEAKGEHHHHYHHHHTEFSPNSEKRRRHATSLPPNSKVTSKPTPVAAQEVTPIPVWHGPGGSRFCEYDLYTNSAKVALPELVPPPRVHSPEGVKPPRTRCPSPTKHHSNKLKKHRPQTKSRNG
ncbi:hypothetical protein K474DRAFT_1704300 [Panus rudis PR-1116 ss-1]|nr:hypothetical protein K474DRAFT_1704300 [Panus rudis PR-1116 ss-1]